MKMSSLQKIVFFSVIFFICSIASFAHAWVEPTTVPPGNNILAPLNSSAFGQSKVGGLILNLGNAAHGLIVRYGLVGIGTDNPQAALDVVGKVRSTGLEVNSTTEGALLPRMTTVQRDAITNKVEGLLIYNTETKQLEIYSDGAWKASSGGGDSLPKGTIAFFNLSTCPSGWTEKTELKGRYPVGLPSPGTLGQSVGTPLTNGENRSVGQHSHGVTDPGHSHTIRPNGGDTRYSGNTWGYGDSNWGVPVYGTSPSTTGLSIQNSGSVAGTNAPYLQLLACEKLTTAAASGGASTTGGSFWQNNGTSIYYNDGNVGVGTSTPAQKMEVAGNVKATGVCIGTDCKSAWPTTTSTDTLQSVTARGNTSNGAVNINGDLSFNSTISTPGRMHINGQEDLYILNKGTTRVSKAWGGTGNLAVEGSLCVGGDCRSAWPDIIAVWNQYSCSPYYHTTRYIGAYDYYFNGKVFMKNCDCLTASHDGYTWSGWSRPYDHIWYNSPNAILGITDSSSTCISACINKFYNNSCVPQF